MRTWAKQVAVITTTKGQPVGTGAVRNVMSTTPWMPGTPCTNDETFNPRKNRRGAGKNTLSPCNYPEHSSATRGLDERRPERSPQPFRADEHRLDRERRETKPEARGRTVVWIELRAGHVGHPSCGAVR